MVWCQHGGTALLRSNGPGKKHREIPGIRHLRSGHFLNNTVSNRRTNCALESSERPSIKSHTGEEITADVVVSNRGAAHSFPPELRDLYEPWVEFQALAADGKEVFHSGFVKPDGTLDESAHVYKQILVDA